MVINKIVDFIFGNTNTQRIKRYKSLVHKINDQEGEIQKLSNQELSQQTAKLRHEIQTKKIPILNILPEAFATVREAAIRSINQRHYDVQVMGAIALQEGLIAEMQTGEGKTLAATMAVYLQALISPGVQVMTVNDYLAKRDAQWMGQIYHKLNLTAGYLENNMPESERLIQYNKDVVYGSNNEFGFDFLRNNLQYEAKNLLPQNFNYAIIDEADSILIDEARTPLVISKSVDVNDKLYYQIQNIVNKIQPQYYQLDEKKQSITLTEDGIAFFENQLHQNKIIDSPQLYDSQNIEIIHYLNQVMRANLLIMRDRDYVIRSGQVLVIDEFTGRIISGRRYSNGLHQAIEAKEKVKINPENQPIATITLQNFFRSYKKLAGMTGTAKTEAEELKEVYNLDVVTILTNKPMIRDDQPDDVFLTKKVKLDQVTKKIIEIHKTGQPVLVGTVSVAGSEEISNLLTKNKVSHQVLNAKNHAKEAQIINQAGKLNSITITTNMAGRGTDIQLGGNKNTFDEQKQHDIKSPQQQKQISEQINKEQEKVIKLGGLYVLGTERHESRRLDNQLRGRAGRQGDPGCSKFFISLEDDLLRIFGSDRLQGILSGLGMDKNESITSPFLTKTITKAQEKIESMNQDRRKNLLQYDNVLDDQRHIIYDYRHKVLTGKNTTTEDEILQESVSTAIKAIITENMYADQWEADLISQAIGKIWPSHKLPIQDWIQENTISLTDLQNRIISAIKKAIDQNIQIPAEKKTWLNKILLLQSIDKQWQHHLFNMFNLRQAIGLRGYAQRNPLHEYKKEALVLFDNLITDIGYEYIKTKLQLQMPNQNNTNNINNHPSLNIKDNELQDKSKTQEMEKLSPAVSNMPSSMTDPLKKNTALKLPEISFSDMFNQSLSQNKNPQQPPTEVKNIRRNDPCYCDSGKKYKHCHGKIS